MIPDRDEARRLQGDPLMTDDTPKTQDKDKDDRAGLIHQTIPEIVEIKRSPTK